MDQDSIIGQVRTPIGVGQLIWCYRTAIEDRLGRFEELGQ